MKDISVYIVHKQTRKEIKIGQIFTSAFVSTKTVSCLCSRCRKPSPISKDPAFLSAQKLFCYFWYSIPFQPTCIYIKFLYKLWVFLPFSSLSLLTFFSHAPQHTHTACPCTLSAPMQLMYIFLPFFIFFGKADVALPTAASPCCVPALSLLCHHHLHVLAPCPTATVATVASTTMPSLPHCAIITLWFVSFPPFFFFFFSLLI